MIRQFFEKFQSKNFEKFQKISNFFRKFFKKVWKNVSKNVHKLFKSNDDFLQIQKHLFKQIIGSKSLILYTKRGIIITGEEREYGILSLMKTYVNVHNIKDEIINFLPYLRLNLTDEITEKVFRSLSMEITPFEVLSSEPRDYALEWSTQSHRCQWGLPPNNVFTEKRTFEAFGNNKYVERTIPGQYVFGDV